MPHPAFVPLSEHWHGATPSDRTCTPAGELKALACASAHPTRRATSAAPQQSDSITENIQDPHADHNALRLVLVRGVKGQRVISDVPPSQADLRTDATPVN